MSEWFTTAEAAKLAGTPARNIEKAIEEGIIEVRRGTLPRMAQSRPRRLLSEQGVYFVAFLKRCDVEFSKAQKRWIWDRFRSTPPNRLSTARWRLSAGLDVRPGELVRPIRERVMRYARARDRWIESRPDVLGGTPVIKGTRLTVYSIAGRMARGETIEDVHQDNPDLSREAIEAAGVYARANPLVGRPSGRPWRQQRA